ncbi:MAG: sulfatase family protein [Thermoguttaceae bacterium]
MIASPARLGACLLVCWLLIPASARAQKPRRPAPDPRPNILLAIADDWGWPHAGAYGDKVVQTPAFDRLARQGVLFTHAFVAAPTCTASRGGLLSGQAIHRLREGGNLWSILPADIPVYPDLLEQAGYAVGSTGKGWGPGTLEGSGRTRNPAGPRFKSFEQFLETVPPEKPFCFWFGSTDPHRPYERDSGLRAGMNPKQVQVPPFLPDTPTVRRDILDYYFEVQRFDREVGRIIQLLEAAGRLENTLVVMTSDNGMPFPRAKATLYDGGTRVPLVVCWMARVRGGRRVEDLVSLTDLAPTFLEAAGLKMLPEMTGRSLLDLLFSGKSGRVDPRRDKVFTERERHAACREGNLSYPVRAMRTHDFLYIRNCRPELMPAGDPDFPNVVGPYGDIDGSPTKSEILQRRGEPAIARYFRLAMEKRPAEELYDLAKDPGQLENVAGKPQYAEVQKRLRSELERWMHQTGDPRARGETDFWDKCPYVGPIRPAKER